MSNSILKYVVLGALALQTSYVNAYVKGEDKEMEKGALPKLFDFQIASKCKDTYLACAGDTYGKIGKAGYDNTNLCSDYDKVTECLSANKDWKKCQKGIIKKGINKFAKECKTNSDNPFGLAENEECNTLGEKCSQEAFSLDFTTMYNAVKADIEEVEGNPGQYYLPGYGGEYNYRRRRYIKDEDKKVMTLPEAMTCDNLKKFAKCTSGDKTCMAYYENRYGDVVDFIETGEKCTSDENLLELVNAKYGDAGSMMPDLPNGENMGIPENMKDAMPEGMPDLPNGENMGIPEGMKEGMPEGMPGMSGEEGGKGYKTEGY